MSRVEVEFIQAVPIRGIVVKPGESRQFDKYVAMGLVARGEAKYITGPRPGKVRKVVEPPALKEPPAEHPVVVSNKERDALLEKLANLRDGSQKGRFRKAQKLVQSLGIRASGWDELFAEVKAHYEG